MWNDVQRDLRNPVNKPLKRQRVRADMDPDRQSDSGWTMGDFHIKKIILPSGKSVEIVYFHAEDDGVATPQLDDNGIVDLECCPECDSRLVYPVSWRETEDDCWEIELRCPNCEWSERGVYRHTDVERFDEVLNRGTDQLIDDLEHVTRSNMEEDIDRFVNALEQDLITPFDF